MLLHAEAQICLNIRPALISRIQSEILTGSLYNGKRPRWWMTAYSYRKFCMRPYSFSYDLASIFWQSRRILPSKNARRFKKSQWTTEVCHSTGLDNFVWGRLRRWESWWECSRTTEPYMNEGQVKQYVGSLRIKQIEFDLLYHQACASSSVDSKDFTILIIKVYLVHQYPQKAFAILSSTSASITVFLRMLTATAIRTC